jgi:hypothetical protein
MTSGLLSWAAQVGDHAAFVAARRITVDTPASAGCTRKRRSPDGAARNRQAILTALRDGRPHRFVDLVTALPGLSRQGIYYLCDALKAEGRIDWVETSRTNRLYRLI